MILLKLFTLVLAFSIYILLGIESLFITYFSLLKLLFNYLICILALSNSISKNFTLSCNLFINLAAGSILIIGLHFILMAWLLYSNVDILSLIKSSIGFMQLIIIVYESSPKPCLSNEVNIESLYGMCLWGVLSVANDVMTFLNVNKDLFIIIPSSACTPVVPVWNSFSDPAKSTNCKLDVDYNICSVLFGGIFYFNILIVNIQCDRLVVSFKLCDPVMVCFKPSDK